MAIVRNATQCQLRYVTANVKVLTIQRTDVAWDTCLWGVDLTAGVTIHRVLRPARISRRTDLVDSGVAEHGVSVHAFTDATQTYLRVNCYRFHAARYCHSTWTTVTALSCYSWIEVDSRVDKADTTDMAATFQYCIWSQSRIFLNRRLYCISVLTP